MAHLSDSINALYQSKVKFYRSQHPEAMTMWRNLSKTLWPAIEKHAPVAASELAGASSGGELNATVMGLLAVEYEVLMALGAEADKCTGFASELGLSRCRPARSATMLTRPVAVMVARQSLGKTTTRTPLSGCRQ